MPDERHHPHGTGVGSGGPAEKHGRFFNMLFGDRQFGKLRQCHRVVRLFEQMLAQQPLGIAAIPCIERQCHLLKNQP